MVFVSLSVRDHTARDGVPASTFPRHSFRPAAWNPATLNLRRFLTDLTLPAGRVSYKSLGGWRAGAMTIGEMLMEKKPQQTEKKQYSKPTIRSQKVLERAALACTGIFNNALFNLKSSFQECGFNDS